MVGDSESEEIYLNRHLKNRSHTEMRNGVKGWMCRVHEMERTGGTLGIPASPIYLKHRNKVLG